MAKDNNKQAKREIESQLLNGIYKAVVKDTLDESRSGRIKVFIPVLGKIDDPNSYRECFWTSPFAGSTDPTQIRKDGIENYEDTQKSYGMWMVPPDINNQVLVAFGDSIGKYGYVIACLFGDKMNHMVPGIPGGLNYGNPSLRMPVAEKNAYDSRPTTNDVERPVHVDLAEAIVKQGLINDPIRGAGSSGARRESPSQVFGILTPGPRDTNLNRTTKENFNHRTGGHQFIMDDNYSSRMIRLRSAQGNQLLLDDTTGVIYMINKKGTAWFEMGTNGDVTIYSEGSINMRAKNNFNLRADKNVNIEAGQNVNIKAAGDNTAGNYQGIPGIGAIGEGPQGSGGNIRFEAAADLTQFAALNAQLTAAGGDIDLSAGNGIKGTASGSGLDFNAATGSITMESASRTSVRSNGFSVDSGIQASINSGQILLNSGGTAAGKADQASPAPQLGTNTILDAAINKPGFDREIAAAGGAGATTNGQRTGSTPAIETIVSVMPTAEPYAGHGQTDPSDGFGEPPRFGPDVIDALPVGASDLSGVPSDVSTPSGFQQGVNYVDSNGNILDFSQDAGSIVDAIPTYGTIANAGNQFSAALDQNLLEIENLNGYIAGLRAVLPAVRFPTSTADGQKVIGLNTALTEQSLQIQQFSVSANAQLLESQDQAVVQLTQSVNSAVNSSSSPEDLTNTLAQQGITVIQDGPGTIYQDQGGVMLVDYTNGIGPIGATLGAVVDLNTVWEQIKRFVTSPVSENQSIALSSFAQSVGIDNFVGSNVLDAVNEGKYSEVPRLMAGWTIAAARPGEEPVYQQSLADRRAWEGSVFQTPDEISINVINGAGEAELSFRQLADLLDQQRDAFYNS